MQAKIIKTEEDHSAALARIEQIFDAKPNTPEGDEFELLAMLVEQYEEKKFPIDLPDPVSAIRFRMEQGGLKPKDLVPFIGSPSKVSEVLSGQRGLSLSMIRKLVEGLGIPAEVLLREPGAAMDPRFSPQECSKFPIGEMVKRGWFAGFRGTIHQARKQLEDLLVDFVEPLGKEALRPALNRHRVRTGKKMDDYALTAWRIRVATVASREEAPDYIPGTLSQDLLRDLIHLSYLDEGPRLAKEFLRKNGIRFVVERHLPGTYLDGAAFRLPNGAPVVALTLRYDRLDNFWFTLFHELAHVALHLEKSDGDAFFDDLDKRGENELERDADEFAQEALVPSKEWETCGLSERSSPVEIKTFAEKQRISPAIPAGRIRFEKKDYTLFSNLVGTKKVRRLFEGIGQ